MLFKIKKCNFFLNTFFTRILIISKYYSLKTQHNKFNFRILLISNKIIIIPLFFNSYNLSI